MRSWNGRCQRCGKETNIHMMSMYSELLICMDCKDEETQRDDYEAARDAEVAQVRQGNYNFKGVGEPR